MPGVAQVWLTQKELSALLIAGSSSARVTAASWPSLEEKLRTARDSLDCPVNPDLIPAWERWPNGAPT